MRNYETTYRIEGTSALNATAVHDAAGCTIIPFPSNRTVSYEGMNGERERTSASWLDSDDDPFPQLDRKSEILLGTLFTVVSTVIVLLGLL